MYGTWYSLHLNSMTVAQPLFRVIQHVLEALVSPYLNFSYLVDKLL